MLMMDKNNLQVARADPGLGGEARTGSLRC